MRASVAVTGAALDTDQAHGAAADVRASETIRETGAAWNSDQARPMLWLKLHGFLKHTREVNSLTLPCLLAPSTPVKLTTLNSLRKRNLRTQKNVT
ncbi:MAG: hypothetical protein LBG97_08740 [Coriobacteriales bacterium]|jgi:hypothetical protein|nr:hypothetical protein [Coriobacteriales bacterium]